MSKILTSLKTEIDSFNESGYKLSFSNGYLIMENVPYLNENKDLKGGILISDASGAKPNTHVIHFSGEYPCTDKGKPIIQIQHQTTNRQIGAGIVSNFSFSNKPDSGLKTYTDKFLHYYQIISSFAQAEFPNAKANSPQLEWKEDKVFHYEDTNSSREYITGISDKLRNQKIAIVGLGGTGSYILDYVAKSPVSEIHIFDGDMFDQHNAFRCPGAANKSVFDSNIDKVEYLSDIYSNMHKNIFTNSIMIDKENIDVLNGFDMVFLSIDNPVPKQDLLPFLEKNKIPFIDVGMSVDVEGDKLYGMLRTTTSSSMNLTGYQNHISTDQLEDDVYASNIQISELNALNAAFAVLRWKKLVGFYHDHLGEHNSLFSINSGQLANEDYTT